MGNLNLDMYAQFGTGDRNPARIITDGILRWLVDENTGALKPQSGQAASGFLRTARVDFVEDATSVSHTASVPIPAGAVIQDIVFLTRALWTAAATLDVGDTADPNGYIAAGDLDDGAAPMEVISFLRDNAYGEAYGAYCFSADDRSLIGPTVNNFGWNYVAGSNLIITVNVATPSATTGRTTVVVYYTVPESIPVVSS